MIRVEFKSFWLFFPDAGHIFERREPSEDLEPSTVILGIDDDVEMLPQRIMVALLVAFDGGILDSAVHPFDLTIGPRLLGLVSRCLMPFSAACLRQLFRTGLSVRLYERVRCGMLGCKA